MKKFAKIVYNEGIKGSDVWADKEGYAILLQDNNEWTMYKYFPFVAIHGSDGEHKDFVHFRIVQVILELTEMGYVISD